ncbi:MAG: hypothetical protein M1837_000124 [Sclerophora amabilis]|nr:MAG: hypothetical protein M1837_000124 [Sclerophora amabilis]
MEAMDELESPSISDRVSNLDEPLDFDPVQALADARPSLISKYSTYSAREVSLTILPTTTTNNHKLTIRKADGVVFRAREKRTARIIALKKVRSDKEHDEPNYMPVTALREISILRSLEHVNIVNVFDVAADFEDKPLRDFYMVMEYAEQVGHLPTPHG